MSRHFIKVGEEGSAVQHTVWFDIPESEEAAALRQTCEQLRAEIRSLNERLAAKPPGDGVTAYQHEMKMSAMRNENADLRRQLKQMSACADREFHRRTAVEKNNSNLKARIEDLHRDLQQSNDMLKKIESIVCPF